MGEPGDGTVYLCNNCGQPATNELEYGFPDGLSMHWSQQWDGVYCNNYPIAGKLIEVDWEPSLLRQIEEQYPNTNPDRNEPAAQPERLFQFPSDGDKRSMSWWRGRYGLWFTYAARTPTTTDWCVAIAHHLGAELGDAGW